MNKELAKTIGTAARKARKALKLTQADAAERLDVSVEFYARIERGTSLPSIVTFARIVSALGVSGDALLGRQPAIVQPLAGTWAPSPPDDSPEVRRVVRRLRKARPATLRLITLLLKEMEPQPGESSEPDTDDSDDEPVISASKALGHEPSTGMRTMTSELRVFPAEPILAAAIE